jgi:hypothetical protein
MNAIRAIIGIVLICGILFGMGHCVYRAAVPAPPPRKTAEQLALESTEAVYGKRPETSDWDGKVYLIDDYLKANLKDPASLEYIQWWKLTPFIWGERDASGAGAQNGWQVSVQYRARNSFGGMVIERQTFLIRDGKIVVTHAMVPAELR